MLRSRFPALFAAVALMTALGCSPQTIAPEDTGNDPGDTATPTEPDEPVDEATLVGTYRLYTRVPTAGSLTDALEDSLGTLTGDPISLLLDALLGDTSGFIRDILELAIPAILSDLNLNDLRTLPTQLSVLLGDIQMTSTLVVDSSGMATHALDSVTVVASGTPRTFNVSELGFGSIRTENVPVQLSGGQMTIGEHTLGLPVGQAIVAALDLESGIGNFAYQLLSELIDCATFAVEVDEALGGNGDYISFATGLCNQGLALAAAKIEDAIGSVEGQSSMMTMQGAASAYDDTRDSVIDKIEDGQWTASIALGEQTVSLVGASFSSEPL